MESDGGVMFDDELPEQPEHERQDAGTPHSDTQLDWDDDGDDEWDEIA